MNDERGCAPAKGVGTDFPGGHTHECATEGLSKKKGIEYARRLLGHSNISTPRRYMHLDDRELAEAQDLVD